MRKYFLGFVCFLYCVLITTVFIKGQMGHYLAPNMEKYLYVVVPCLLIIGIVLMFSKEKEAFDYKDIILFLPLAMLFLAGDGNLTIAHATNRSSSFNSIKDNEVISVEKEVFDESYSEYDFSNVDFEVVDESYSGLSDAIMYSRNPEKLVGRTIRLRGFTMKNHSFIPDGTIGIGKYLISCCAADASFVGFLVVGDISSLKNNTWYEIEGVLEMGKDSYGQTILLIRLVHSKAISSKGEEQYVYPCYSYGNGKCSEVTKYNFD